MVESNIGQNQNLQQTFEIVCKELLHIRPDNQVLEIFESNNLNFVDYFFILLGADGVTAQSPYLLREVFNDRSNIVAVLAGEQQNTL